MVPNDPKWSQMVLNGLKWSQMVPNDLKWSQMVLNGLKWSQMVPNGPKKSQIVPNCPKRSQMIPNWPKGFQMVLNGPKWTLWYTLPCLFCIIAISNSKKIINAIFMGFFLLKVLVSCFVMVPVGDPVLVPVPVPVPDQNWSRSRHISGPRLGPGPGLVIFLVWVKISAPVTQWLHH